LQVAQKVIPTAATAQAAGAYKSFTGWMAVPHAADTNTINNANIITNTNIMGNNTNIM
jgi:hypothetical protein